MGVSRSGFHAWLNRSPTARSRSDDAVGQQVKASFVASDRTYGARRVWRDPLADGVECGLHRIERLMRLQALRARPRRRRLPKDEGDRQVANVPANRGISLTSRPSNRQQLTFPSLTKARGSEQ
jgi:putative transposase